MTSTPLNHQSSCARWIDYFRGNSGGDTSIPWSPRPTLTMRQVDDVVASIQTFQLGESGEGRHIVACARAWVRRGGDPDYVIALQMFLAEEHRHSRWLAKFLQQEHATLLQKQWSDSCFRQLRHAADLRMSIAVLVTAEILAQVYYLALSRSTDSPTLRAICRRILRDERAHVLFQQSHADRLSATWSRPKRWIVQQLERGLFIVAKRIVWHDHRRVFAAAEMTWAEYDQRADRRWRAARRSGRRAVVTVSDSEADQASTGVLRSCSHSV